MKRFKCLLAALAVATALPVWASSSNPYPERPIRLVVPTGSGGTSDVLGRIVAEEMRRKIGQSIVVENKGGANGNIGAAAVAKTAADGYTLLLSSSLLSSSASLYKTLPFDAMNDFKPVGLIATTPYFLIVSGKAAPKSVPELIALARSQPGKIAYASVGVGSGPHLAGEQFSRQVGVEMLHVPFAGAGQAVTELLTGRVQLMFVGLPPVQGHVKSGALRILGVAEPKRSGFLPEVPTIAESGVPGFEVTTWFGLFAPAGTPDAVVQKLSGVLDEVLKEPEVRERFKSLGAVPNFRNPADFAAFYKGDVESLAKVIKAANISIE